MIFVKEFLGTFNFYNVIIFRIIINMIIPAWITSTKSKIMYVT